MIGRLAFFGFLFCMVVLSASAQAATAILLRLTQGQTTPLAQSALTVSAIKVTDLTAMGCEGGPRGCPDRVDLTIGLGANRQTATLFVAHTTQQAALGINRKTLFGYQFVLSAVHGNSADLSVQRISDLAPH